MRATDALPRDVFQQRRFRQHGGGAAGGGRIRGLPGLPGRRRPGSRRAHPCAGTRPALPCRGGPGGPVDWGLARVKRTSGSGKRRSPTASPGTT